MCTARVTVHVKILMCTLLCPWHTKHCKIHPSNCKSWGLCNSTFRSGGGSGNLELWMAFLSTYCRLNIFSIAFWHTVGLMVSSMLVSMQSLWCSHWHTVGLKYACLNAVTVMLTPQWWSFECVSMMIKSVNEELARRRTGKVLDYLAI